jgi:hypothetical protein
LQGLGKPRLLPYKEVPVGLISSSFSGAGISNEGKETVVEADENTTGLNSGTGLGLTTV